MLFVGWNKMERRVGWKGGEKGRELDNDSVRRGDGREEWVVWVDSEFRQISGEVIDVSIFDSSNVNSTVSSLASFGISWD